VATRLKTLKNELLISLPARPDMVLIAFPLGVSHIDTAGRRNKRAATGLPSRSDSIGGP
jgi:hypothetical protein